MRMNGSMWLICRPYSSLFAQLNKVNCLYHSAINQASYKKGAAAYTSAPFWRSNAINIRIFCRFNFGKTYSSASVLEVECYSQLVVKQVNRVDKPVYQPLFALLRGDVQLFEFLYAEPYLLFRQKGLFYFLLQNGDLKLLLSAFKLCKSIFGVLRNNALLDGVHYVAYALLRIFELCL